MFVAVRSDQVGASGVPLGKAASQRLNPNGAGAPQIDVKVMTTQLGRAAPLQRVWNGSRDRRGRLKSSRWLMLVAAANAVALA